MVEDSAQNFPETSDSLNISVENERQDIAILLALTGKQGDILARFDNLVETSNRDNWGDGALQEAINNLVDIAHFFKDVHDDLVATLKTYFPEGENVDVLVDIFLEGVDLKLEGAADIHKKKTEFLANIKVLLQTKDQITSITEEFDIKEWVKILKENPKEFQTKITAFLKEKQSELEGRLAEVEQKRDAVRHLVQTGLFSDSEKEELIGNISSLDSVQVLEKEVKRLNTLNKRRQKTSEHRYKVAVLDNLDNPLHAKKILKDLTKKFGWGVLEFLGADDLNEKLDMILSLQEEQKAKISRLSQLGQEKNVLQEKSDALRKDIDELDNQLGELTGKNQLADDYHEYSYLYEENEASELKEDSPEALQLKIKSLENVLKAVSVWRKQASNYYEIGDENQADISAEYAEDAQKIAWQGGPARRAKLLKLKSKYGGANAWEDYLTENANCNFSVPKDSQTHLRSGEEWHPRALAIPLKNLTAGAAQGLNDRIESLLLDPKLLFLAGEFILNPQDDKYKKPSPLNEVEEQVLGKLSDLRKQLHNKQLKKAA